MNKGFASLATAALFSMSAAQAATIELVSQSSETATVSANGSSSTGTFSPDGKFILFTSSAGDLANLSENGRLQLFLLNTTNNSVQLVSARQGGGFANGDSVIGSISADNRFVAFQSSANNFTTGDTNQTSDIYVRDLTTGATTLVSHDAAGNAGNDRSEYPQISANGDVVVFQSNARNLTANDTNILADIFAWNRAANSLELVSVSANGFSANTDASDFSMTPDGRYVLFVASGANLVVPGKTSANEVYLRDLQAGTTRWVSSVVTNLTGLTTATSANAEISSDGRFVFFVATPTNSVTTSTMVRVDLNDDSTVIIATNIPPPAAYAESFGPSVSDDGQFAAFTYRTNVVRWSAATGLFERVDVNTTGTAVVSDTPIISHDGSKVAFLSASTNLVADVGNGEVQIYVRDVAAGETRMVTKSLTGAPTFGNELAYFQFSPDGSTLIFDSGSTELAAGDNNNEWDLFSWKVSDGSITLLSTSRATAPSLTAIGQSAIGRDSVSADGRFIAFRSIAKLNSKDTNGTYDVYVFDRVAKTNVIVSAGPDGFSVAGGATGIPMISADGTKVAFESGTVGLAGPGDNRVGTSVYVRDLQTGELVNISGANTGSLTLRMLSANGRYVFFTTSTVNANQLHRYDLVDKVDVLEATAASYGDMSVSADGSRVAYVTGLSPLYFHDYASGDPRQVVASGSLSSDVPSRPMLSSDGSILVYAQAGTFRQTNLVTGATKQSGPVRVTRASMSADGQIVAFESRPTPGPWEIWLLDWATGETNLITKAAGASTTGNGNSEAPSVSANGRFIAFESWATDLVANDSNNIKDVFVYDRSTAQLTLGSHASGTSSPGNSASFNPFFGRGEPFLVFSSGAADLVAGDLNDSIDVFVSRMDESVSSQDSDNDGLDDAWEQATFSSLAFGANDDPDADGATNLQEFKAGTNANDVASVFLIQSANVAGDGLVSLQWKSAAGRKYQLEWTQTLDTPSWGATGTEITGSGAVMTVPAPLVGFYRLRIVE